MLHELSNPNIIGAHVCLKIKHINPIRNCSFIIKEHRSPSFFGPNHSITRFIIVKFELLMISPLLFRTNLISFNFSSKLKKGINPFLNFGSLVSPAYSSLYSVNELYISPSFSLNFGNLCLGHGTTPNSCGDE